jgi:hypothetical protein
MSTGDPAHPDAGHGHLYTITVAVRAAFGVQFPADAVPFDYERAYLPVQVQAFDLPTALRLAADLPITAWRDDDEAGR